MWIPFGLRALSSAAVPIFFSVGSWTIDRRRIPLTPIAGKSRSQCLESTLPASYTRQISLLIGPRSRSCWPSTSDLAHHSGGAIKSLGGYYGRGNRDCGGQSDGRKKSRQRMDQDGWQYTPLKTGGKSMIVEKFVHRNNPFLTRQAGQLSHIRLCHSIKGQASLCWTASTDNVLLKT